MLQADQLSSKPSDVEQAKDVVTEENEATDAPLRQTFALGSVTGEALAWTGVLVVALFVRLANLGAGALSVEGARHAYAAFTLYRGTGAQLDLNANGPFGTLLTALLFFLFGISDETARLGPVLAGIGTVALVIGLRHYIGRVAALLAALLLAVSPSLVYFARLDQPDAYAAFLAVLVLVALLRLLDHGRRGDLLLLAGAVGALFLSAPVGFTLVLIFAGALAMVWSRGASDEDERPFGAPVLRAALQRGRWLALLTLLLAVLLIVSGFGAAPNNLLHLGGWFGVWAGSLLGPAVAEPGRGPLFALALLPLYEPLALVAGLIGVVRLFRGARPAAGLRGGNAPRAILAGWAAAGIVLLALGGGQQPELILLPAVPLMLLAGMTLSELFGAIDWRRERASWQGSVPVAIFGLLAVAAWFAFIGQLVQPPRYVDESQRIAVTFTTLLLFAAPLTAAAIWFAVRTDRAVGRRIFALAAVVLLFAYGFRSMVGLSIYRAAAANEPLVYQISTPEVRPLMDRLLTLSRDLTAINRTLDDPTGGHGLSVLLDPSVEWPARWYLRDFPNLRIGPVSALTNSATAAPPQLVIRGSTGPPAPADLYREVPYKLQWSFPADQPLVGAENGLLRVLGFIIFRNNVAPAPAQEIVVGYGPDLAQRLFPPQPAQGPFGLNDRPGLGKAPGQFNSPRAIAVAPDGSVYVVDMKNARVQRFSQQGDPLRQFGGLGHGDGQLWYEQGRGPTGIAISQDGFVYVADTWNYRIEKYTLDGQFVMKWGTFLNLVTGGAAAGDRTQGFFGPRGVAIGPDGDVYVTDTGNGRVVVFGPDGAFRREFGSKGNRPGQLDEPVGIVVSADGSRVYVADSNNARISIFDPQGKPLAQWPVEAWRGKAFFEPYLALDANGILYASSSATRQVLKFNQQGQLIAGLVTGAQPEDAFSAPYGVAVAPDGTVYVSDGVKHFVTKLR